MTVSRPDLFTFRQSDETLSSSGVDSLTEERAGGGVEPGDARAIPVLSDTAVNVASVPQRSPLRYPGGKTCLCPKYGGFLQGSTSAQKYSSEPFAGGGIASLTAVIEGYVDRAVLCERDPDISNLWQCMLDDAEELARPRRKVS